MKNVVRRLIRKLGYEVSRHNPDALGRDLLRDVAFFLGGTQSPLILDVGANVGQSVDGFKRAFQSSLVG